MKMRAQRASILPVKTACLWSSLVASTVTCSSSSHPLHARATETTAPGEYASRGERLHADITYQPERPFSDIDSVEIFSDARPEPTDARAQEIREAVRAHNAELRECYEEGLRRDRTLAGRLIIRFLIDAAGTVTHATTVEVTLADGKVVDCVLERARSWKFAPSLSGRASMVTYPFNFVQP